MLKRLILAAAAFAAAMAAPALPAHAQVTVDIVEGQLRPLPIAIPDFNVTSPEAREVADDIADVVRADLASTGLFDIKDEAAFIQRDLDIGAEPRFADWKIIQTDALVVGEAATLPDGRVSVAFRLWDIYGEEVLRIDGQPGKRYSTTPENWRRVAHKIADSIYSRLTGEAGYLDTRLVFVQETGPKTERVKKLAIMDADGANVIPLTSGVYTVLTPRFSTSDQEIGRAHV